MAFTRAASSDTDASVQERAYGTIKGVSPVSPLTAEITPASQSLGKTRLKFQPIIPPEPARTLRDVDTPLRTGRETRPSGQQGSTGNPLGDSIERLGQSLRGEGRRFFEDLAVREGFGELDANLISAQPVVPRSITDFGGGQFGTFSPASQAQSFGGNFGGGLGGFAGATPGFGAGATQLPSFFNEGGFIRKKT